MLKEKECRVIAGRAFADAIGIDRLKKVKDRIVTTQRIEENTFIMSFGVFDDFVKEDSNNYADKLMTVDIDMTNGALEIVYKARTIDWVDTN